MYDLPSIILSRSWPRLTDTDAVRRWNSAAAVEAGLWSGTAPAMRPRRPRAKGGAA